MSRRADAMVDGIIGVGEEESVVHGKEREEEEEKRKCSFKHSVPAALTT